MRQLLLLCYYLNILITIRFRRIKKIGKGVLHEVSKCIEKVSVTCFEIRFTHISRGFILVLLLTSVFEMEIKYDYDRRRFWYIKVQKMLEKRSAKIYFQPAV